MPETRKHPITGALRNMFIFMFVHFCRSSLEGHTDTRNGRCLWGREVVGT